MGSFASWVKKKDVNCDIETEIHVNFFIDYDKNDMPMLDFGLKIKEAKNIDKLYVFIPYRLNECKIQDLGKILSSKKEVLNALFLENYEVRNINIPKFAEVQKEEKLMFYIYSLDIEHDIKVEHDYHGTILEIGIGDLPKKVQNADIYYRFRILDQALEKMKVDIKPKDAILLSSVIRQSFIDFRFNDQRSLDQSLLEKMGISDNSMVKIKKLHFLLITRADVNVDSKEPHLERVLETEIWGQYFDNMSKPLMVANHWKRKAEEGYVDNAIIYVKFRENTCSWKTIGMYLLGLSVLTILFNFLSNCLWQLF